MSTKLMIFVITIVAILIIYTYDSGKHYRHKSYRHYRGPRDYRERFDGWCNVSEDQYNKCNNECKPVPQKYEDESRAAGGDRPGYDLCMQDCGADPIDMMGCSWYT